ncbi:MAG: type II 3-dehydroquinate dehydratase [Clostridia bacterium]|jgi:3-dehydroquinate dehydratase-2|nr:type II 3-dehydroquinate dehydratase [Clostridia bacterium]
MKKTKKILVLNGPNLNMLGVREPELYGKQTYRDLVEAIEKHARERGAFVTVFQSNSEAVLVTKIQRALGIYDGIVINPAAYTHTSVALLDALKAVAIPTVEVHLSDVSRREDFRQISYVRLAAAKTIMGRGFDGYLDAMDFLLSIGDGESEES